MARNQTYLTGRYVVTLDDGQELDVELSLQDTLAYERMMKGQSPLAGVAEQQMIPATAYTRLVWLAARRLQLTNLTPYGAFEARLVDLEEIEDEPAPDEGPIVTEDGQEYGGGVELPDPTQTAPTHD